MYVKLHKEVKKGISDLALEIFDETHKDLKGIPITKKFGMEQDDGVPSIQSEIASLYRKVFIKIYDQVKVEEVISNYKPDHLYKQGSANKDGGIRTTYFECYSLYIIVESKLFANEFKLQSIMEKLISILLEKEKITKEIAEEQLRMNPGFKNSKETAQLYDFYYYGNDKKKVLKFEAEIYYNQQKVRIPKAPSGHTFEGTINYDWPTVTSMEMENKDSINKRILYIIVVDDLKHFSERELSIGVYANVDEKTMPVCGAILIIKKNSADNINDEISPSIKYFLNNKDITIKPEGIVTKEDLVEYLDEKYKSWEDEIKIYTLLSGSYFSYMITKENKILKSVLEIKDNGEVICQTRTRVKLKGNLKIISQEMVSIELIDNENKNPLIVFLKIPELTEFEYLKGIYSKIYRYTKLRGGRILLKKQQDNIKDKLPKTINLDSTEHDKISKQITSFNSFFSSEKDSFIDNANMHDRISNMIFPRKQNKVLLKRIAGVYRYYRISTHKPKSLKVYPISITANGFVLIKGEHNYNGYALVYNNNLYIHTFHSVESSTKTDNVLHTEKKYDGLAIFQIPKDFSKDTSFFCGIYTSVSHNKEAVSGKLVMFRSSKPIEELDKQLIDISKNYVNEVDDDDIKIINYLTNKKSYLKINKDENLNNTITSSKNKISSDYQLFYTACFFATKNNKSKTISLVEDALKDGFNDFSLLKEELNSTLESYEKEILGLWKQYWFK